MLHLTHYRARIACLPLACLLLFAGLSGTAGATVPDTVNYQGFITDDIGAAIDDVVDIRFTLYDAAVGGNILWSATQMVSVSSGLFEVALGGPGNPFPVDLFDTPLYLGVTVGTDPEMVPRRPLASSAYAFKANDADSVQGLSAASLDQSSHVSDTSNPHAVDWFQLSGIPAGFADQIDDDSGGDITGLDAGFGLIGGGTSGDVDLEVDLNRIQGRIGVGCPAGQAIQTVLRSGAVTCEPDDDTSAATQCGGGLLLDGNGDCVAPDGHDHVNQSWSAFSSGDVILTVTNLSSTLGSSAMEGRGANGPTDGYLGVVGATDFQGITGLAIAGDEIGVLGVSTGASASDNVGLYGFSNGVGVVAQGDSLAGRFIGDVEITGNLTGNVSVEGDLVADRVVYNTPRTHFYAVADGDFIARQNEPFETGVGTGGSYFITTGSGGLIAGLHLPDGATIVGMQAIVDDNAAGNLSITLSRRQHTATEFVTMANVVSSGTPGITTLTDTSISSPTIDNATYGYHVRAFSSSWPGNSTLKIKGVVVEYTITEAE